MDIKDTQKAVADYLEKHGIKYTAKFIPQSQSRHSQEKTRTINWKITISSNRGSFTTDYGQGIGHIPDWQAPYSRISLRDETRILFATEKGRYIPSGVNWPKMSLPEHYGKPLPIPSAADVVYSLLMDSDVIDYPFFEDWARDFGYDADSRKGEQVYNECRRIAREFLAVIGYSGRDELKEILQDY